MASTATDAAAAERLLLQISSQLAHSQQQPQNTPADDDAKRLRETVQTLGAVSTPADTMALIAPKLFRSAPPADPGALSGRDALAVLGLLVSADPGTYLKPASRAVRSAAESLASPDGAAAAADADASDDVLAAIVSQLSGDDVEASDNATGTLSALSKALGPPLRDRAIRSVGGAWREALRRGERSAAEKRRASTVAVRCASAAVDVANMGDDAMESFLSTGVGDLLIDMETDSSDPLLQVSAVDLIERMATALPMHNGRAHWLFSHRVLHELLTMAGGGGHGEEKEPAQPDPILGGPALRTLSSLCRLGQRDASLFSLGGSELLQGFHRALHGFEEHLSGEVDRMAFIDAVSSFASASPDAVALVLDDPVLRDGWLTVTVAQPKLKSVVLHSVATVIDPPTEKDSSGDTIMNANIPSNQISMRLFSTLGSVNGKDPTELVLTAAKSPLVETRLGAYELLRAVAKCGTGAQILLSYEGFYDFLVQREKETTKEGKEAKYDIIKAVMESDAKCLLADSIVEALEKFLEQGPHYVQTQPWELATE